MDWASLSSLCVCLLLMYACRLCIVPMWVLVETPLSQCGVVWVVRIRGVLAACLGGFHHLLIGPRFHCLLCPCVF